MTFNLIETLDDLDFLNQELLLKPYVGVDSEFIRTSKNNMKMALLQINDGEEIYLVDTILIGRPGEHCSFLFSDEVVKIFHSCKEDIEAVYSWTSKKMVNLFDTQLAEAFLNNHYSISYQGLVEEKLGITVDKGETRSNWKRRPLTDSQLHYAASDVEFLIELFLEQKKSLSKSNKLDWHDQELIFLSSKIFTFTNSNENIHTGISKAEENNLLNKFDNIVCRIARSKDINPTLFFSKKSQRDFLKIVLAKGISEACSEITNWRKLLIEQELFELLR